MQIINKIQQKAYEDELARVEASKPRPTEVIMNDMGWPLELEVGRLVVMPGDYYNEEHHIVIAAADIGEEGAWEEVAS